MHLKLHILIFHITCSGYCAAWGCGFWALHVLGDGNESRWGALAVGSGTVWSGMPAEGWGNVILQAQTPWPLLLFVLFMFLICGIYHQ